MELVDDIDAAVAQEMSDLAPPPRGDLEHPRGLPVRVEASRLALTRRRTAQAGDGASNGQGAAPSTWAARDINNAS